MLFNQTKRKFQQLNQAPEEVRIRAAVRMSVALGIIIIPLALLVLLPLQLKIQQGRNQEESRDVANQNNQSQSIISRLRQLTNRQANNEETNINAPQVGGVSDANKQYLPIPNFPDSDTSQKLLNNGVQIPNYEPTPSPAIKAFDTNNIPVEITP